MRYFTKELWKQINSDNENVRYQAESAWREMDKCYASYFEKIKQHIPHELKELSFHDSIIENISLNMKNNSCYNCSFELSVGGNKLRIIFYDISEFFLKFDEINYAANKRFFWGYEEWEVLFNNNLSPNGFRLSILCDFSNEISFVFKNATLEKT